MHNKIPKMLDIEKREDSYAIRSKANLKAINYKLMKSIFVGALRTFEMKFGKDFEGHDQVKSEVFRLGNDAVREFERILDDFFNIEEVPNVLTTKKDI